MLDPETRWTRLWWRRGLYNAIRITSGMRVKDLPIWFRPCFDAQAGSLEPLRFRAGKFIHVTWNQAHPLYWPDATETPIDDGGYLVAMPDGGVHVLPVYQGEYWGADNA